VVSLVTKSLVRTFSRNVWQVIFTPTICNMNCQHSYRMFLYKHDDRCTTSMTERCLISVRLSGSIWTINSQTDRLVEAVHKIGHHGHLIWTHQITMCGVTWKLWCIHTRWTWENYSSEFSVLQEASTTLQCFILWSHKSENASKQTEDTLNNLFEWWTANL
jgi:hypothetical protein